MLMIYQAFVIDPWWCPGAEDQAVDRIHRLGQTRDVVIYKFVVEVCTAYRFLGEQSLTVNRIR